MNKLSEHFEDHRLFGRGMYEAFKPHPASFDAGFLSLGLEDTDRHRAAVIAFEDDPKAVESAKCAGLFVCALTTRFDEEHFLSYNHKPDIIIDTFASLLATGKIGNFTV